MSKASILYEIIMESRLFTQEVPQPERVDFFRFELKDSHRLKIILNQTVEKGKREQEFQITIAREGEVLSWDYVAMKSVCE